MSTDDHRDRHSLESRARRRVAVKMGFLIHATVFVVVNVALYAIGVASGSLHGPRFPVWGWGLGLAIHGLVTLWILKGEGLRTRMLDAEMARLRRDQR